MKLVEIRLPQEPDKSFIFYHDAENPFAQWHNHPEYELVLVTKGKGKRTVGDMIERFEENDLAFLGPFLPHEWLCDKEFFTPGGFTGECIVIQFDQSFLGNIFFSLPENKPLQKILSDASMGCKFSAAASNIIIPILKKMLLMDDTDRLYALLSIFQVLSRTTAYETLSSPHFVETFHNDENELLKKCIKYMLLNFHENIPLKKMLDISHKSNSAFHALFKKTYRMTFKEYLLKIRIGYACRLLIEDTKSIVTISFESGFENLSNFNRQFKKIKKVTPTEYKAFKKRM